MSIISSCKSCGRSLPEDAPGGLCPACVLSAAADSVPLPAGPSVEEIQRAFPQLEIIECIGRGGMGIVYKAFQPHLGRHVALKLLDPSLQTSPGFAERFAREARILGQLAHPNIVAIHDFGEAEGWFWLMMEFVDGVNLRQAMQAGRFSPAQALAVIPGICTALQFAHDHGVLHRDIKPENILLDARGRVKVADFGIARLAGDAQPHTPLTMTGTILGSAAYVAPEQIERPHQVDHRADLYSVGVVFYEMLTGELPLGRFAAPSEKSTSDPRLDEVVFRTLEKEREKRYQSADAVKVGVETACHGPAAPAARPPTGTSADQISRTFFHTSLGLLLGGVVAGIVGAFTSPVVFGLGIVAAVLGIAGSWWMLHQSRAGGFPSEHRKLLLGLSFWPVVAVIFAAVAIIWIRLLPLHL